MVFEIGRMTATRSGSADATGDSVERQPLQVESILGFPITTLSASMCVDMAISWINVNHGALFFACANPHSLELACRDEQFASALREADLLTPDGVGIVLASRLLGGAIRQRVTGSDIFAGLNQALNSKGGYRVFFLGSTPSSLEMICKKMADVYPRISVLGTYSPPFKAEFSPEDSRRMVEAVNACKPDVLWVGMTAPKQEKWIYLYRQHLNVNFIGAVGAVFDFFIGKVKRSHPFFQNNGLEWLPRFIQEPKRLWRRNFVSAPKFFIEVLREKKQQNSKLGRTE